MPFLVKSALNRGMHLEYYSSLHEIHSTGQVEIASSTHSALQEGSVTSAVLPSLDILNASGHSSTQDSQATHSSALITSTFAMENLHSGEFL